ncbi:MAG TPA: hypothetical protein VFL98_03245 [Candidatus Paceibacterota bacterium]|nr:hypothetical protein [Candidatus Paceibacterota bacterium]
MTDRTDTRGTEVGFIVEAKQYVLTIEGLPSARVHDVIVSQSGSRALVRSLADDRLTALALDPVAPRVGDRYGFLPDDRIFALGEHLFGRTITVLGEPIDGGAPFPAGNARLTLDAQAPGIDVRAPIAGMLETGVTLIDALIPIAKGQRQLLFGGAPGSKASFLEDVTLHQASLGAVCIYAAIGMSLSELERIERRVMRAATGDVILIAALSDQPSARIMLAPAIAFEIAAHFQGQGRDVLVILDDLDVHAKYLREVALLEGRLPGRESYPGDLFYEHAHLLERAGTFVPEFGGGSITALPVIRSDPNAALGIVSTNLMSTTDGHLAFDPALEREGAYPAVDEAASITRVGRLSQTLLEKQLSLEVRQRLAEAKRQRQYAAFGAPLGKAAADAVRQADIIMALLRQRPGERVPRDLETPLLTLAFTPLLLSKDTAFAAAKRQQLLDGLGADPALAELRTSAREGSMPFDAFRRLVEGKQAAFEALCRD